EVASIKPTPPANIDKGSMTLFLPGGGFRTTNATLKSLVALAYGLQDYQVSGGPKWVETDRFDIDAKPNTKVSRDQVLVMIQALLAERFKLMVRRDTKEGSIYVLVVAKNGPKLQAVSEAESPNARFNSFKGKRSMEQFAAYLSTVAGQLVVDKTGLTGVF